MVDGTESTIHDFGPPLPWHEEAKFTLSTLLLGHVTFSDGGKLPKASVHDGYQIGNVFVFAGRLCQFKLLRRKWGDAVA